MNPAKENKKLWKEVERLDKRIAALREERKKLEEQKRDPESLKRLKRLEEERDTLRSKITAYLQIIEMHKRIQTLERERELIGEQLKQQMSNPSERAILETRSEFRQKEIGELIEAFKRQIRELAK